MVAQTLPYAEARPLKRKKVKSDLPKYQQDEMSEDDELREGETSVLLINKARMNTFFIQSVENAREFFKKATIEFRLTMGQSWQNVLYTVKGPYMNKFAFTDFKRGSADLYS